MRCSGGERLGEYFRSTDEPGTVRGIQDRTMQVRDISIALRNIICADRPARDMHQIVEVIVQQLTTLPGASVELKLDIDAEVPAGIDKAKSRTLLENANTLGFIDKALD